jgi:hypothetical protein
METKSILTVVALGVVATVIGIAIAKRVGVLS